MKCLNCGEMFDNGKKSGNRLTRANYRRDRTYTFYCSSRCRQYIRRVWEAAHVLMVHGDERTYHGFYSGDWSKRYRKSVERAQEFLGSL